MSNTRDPHAACPPVDEPDTEATMAGWDPYIVALANGGTRPRAGHERASADKAPADSRELGVMAWLATHGA